MGKTKTAEAQHHQNGKVKPAPDPRYGCFMADGQRRVDMVMTYEDEPENSRQEVSQIDIRRRFFQNNLKKEGLELEVDHFQESDKVMVVVKLHAPWPLLCKYAEELHIKTPLKVRDNPLKVGRFGRGNNSWAKATAKVSYAKAWDVRNENGSGSPTVAPVGRQQNAHPYSDSSANDVDNPKNVINWPFKRKHVDRYDVRDQRTFFADRQRIEIIWEILQKVGNDANDPKKRGIESLLERKVYDTVFPLHDGDLNSTRLTPAPLWTSRQRLKATWASWSRLIQMQPLWDVRNYFGEKIGFYFAFMDSYTRWLIIPSVFGLAAFCFGLLYSKNLTELPMICKSLHHGASTHGTAGATTAASGHQGGQRSTGVNSSNRIYSDSVADLWMCPICHPPACEVWEMYEEGCFQYLWAFRLDNEASVTLSCIVILWAVLFLKCWRRRESKLAVDWDTHDAEEHDMIIRPSYEERAPRQRRNPITLETEPYIPMQSRFCRLSVSVLATMFMLLIAAGGLLTLVVSRIALYGGLREVGGFFAKHNVELARWLIHGLIFIMVSIFESVYHWVAHKLTEFECAKTQSQFMSSLLWKIFIFEMLNDFVPIAYAAWVKGKVPTPFSLDFMTELCDGGCIGEVTELVAVLLLARLVVGNTMEVGVPFIKRSYREYVQRKEDEAAERDDDDDRRRRPLKPQWQQDMNLEEVELDGVYDEYMEMMIQFSFIVFFSPALPVAPFLCFLNNVVEIRVDAINVLQAHRRPLPIRVPGIQIWNNFMDIIIKLGIIINAGLIAFTSDNVPRLYYKYLVSPTGTYLGFTRFSLSWIPINGWPASKRSALMIQNKLDGCWYPDWRYDYAPYPERPEYYQIFTLRMAVFAMFCMAFFILMWFLNTFISDVPAVARTKIHRRQYVVAKAFEYESACESGSAKVGPAKSILAKLRQSKMTAVAEDPPNDQQTSNNINTTSDNLVEETNFG